MKASLLFGWSKDGISKGSLTCWQRRGDDLGHTPSQSTQTHPRIGDQAMLQRLCVFLLACSGLAVVVTAQSIYERVDPTPVNGASREECEELMGRWRIRERSLSRQSQQCSQKCSEANSKVHVLAKPPYPAAPWPFKSVCGSVFSQYKQCLQARVRETCAAKQRSIAYSACMQSVEMYKQAERQANRNRLETERLLRSTTGDKLTNEFSKRLVDFGMKPLMNGLQNQIRNSPAGDLMQVYDALQGQLARFNRFKKSVTAASSAGQFLAQLAKGGPRGDMDQRFQEVYTHIHHIGH